MLVCCGRTRRNSDESEKKKKKRPTTKPAGKHETDENTPESSAHRITGSGKTTGPGAGQSQFEDGRPPGLEKFPNSGEGRSNVVVVKVNPFVINNGDRDDDSSFEYGTPGKTRPGCTDGNLSRTNTSWQKSENLNSSKVDPDDGVRSPSTGTYPSPVHARKTTSVTSSGSRSADLNHNKPSVFSMNTYMVSGEEASSSQESSNYQVPTIRKEQSTFGLKHSPSSSSSSHQIVPTPGISRTLTSRPSFGTPHATPTGIKSSKSNEHLLNNIPLQANLSNRLRSNDSEGYYTENTHSSMSRTTTSPSPGREYNSMRNADSTDSVFKSPVGTSTFNEVSTCSTSKSIEDLLLTSTPSPSERPLQRNVVGHSAVAQYKTLRLGVLQATSKLLDFVGGIWKRHEDMHSKLAHINFYCLSLKTSLLELEKFGVVLQSKFSRSQTMEKKLFMQVKLLKEINNGIDTYLESLNSSFYNKNEQVASPGGNANDEDLRIKVGNIIHLTRVIPGLVRTFGLFVEKYEKEILVKENDLELGVEVGANGHSETIEMTTGPGVGDVSGGEMEDPSDLKEENNPNMESRWNETKSTQRIVLETIEMPVQENAKQNDSDCLPSSELTETNSFASFIKEGNRAWVKAHGGKSEETKLPNQNKLEYVQKNASNGMSGNSGKLLETESSRKDAATKTEGNKSTMDLHSNDLISEKKNGEWNDIDSAVTVVNGESVSAEGETEKVKTSGNDGMAIVENISNMGDRKTNIPVKVTGPKAASGVSPPCPPPRSSIPPTTSSPITSHSQPNLTSSHVYSVPNVIPPSPTSRDPPALPPKRKHVIQNKTDQTGDGNLDKTDSTEVRCSDQTLSSEGTRNDAGKNNSVEVGGSHSVKTGGKTRNKLYLDQQFDRINQMLDPDFTGTYFNSSENIPVRSDSEGDLLAKKLTKSFTDLTSSSQLLKRREHGPGRAQSHGNNLSQPVEDVGSADPGKVVSLPEFEVPDIRASGISITVQTKLEELQREANSQNVSVHTDAGCGFADYDIPAGVMELGYQTLCEADCKLLLFYSDQLNGHWNVLLNAADAFFGCMERKQQPKVFVVYSKFVILAGQKMAYIGDMLARNLADREARLWLANYGNQLCESLKQAVRATKDAALGYPAITPVQAMVDSIKEVTDRAVALKEVVFRLTFIGKDDPDLS